MQGYNYKYSEQKIKSKHMFLSNKSIEYVCTMIKNFHQGKSRCSLVINLVNLSSYNTTDPKIGMYP